MIRGPNVSVEHDAEVERRDGLEKRGSFGGRATFFEVGLGACGKMSYDSDFVSDTSVRLETLCTLSEEESVGKLIPNFLYLLATCFFFFWLDGRFESGSVR